MGWWALEPGGFPNEQTLHDLSAKHRSSPDPSLSGIYEEAAASRVYAVTAIAYGSGCSEGKGTWTRERGNNSGGRGGRS